MKELNLFETRTVIIFPVLFSVIRRNNFTFKTIHFSLKTSTTWKAGSSGYKIHIIEQWRMLSFCKIPSCFPPFIKPRPSLSHPPRLISSLLLPRFQVKQKRMLRRHRKWRWGRDPPPARAPAGRRPVPSAAWSGSQNLPKEIQEGVIETGGWPLIKGIWDEEKNEEGKERQYYITFSPLKRRHSGFTGTKHVIRGRFNFNKCGLVFWLQASFDLCLNICIRLYLPFPKNHIQGHPRWIYFVLILYWHDMVQWDVLQHVCSP